MAVPGGTCLRPAALDKCDLSLRRTSCQGSATLPAPWLPQPDHMSLYCLLPRQRGGGTGQVRAEVQEAGVHCACAWLTLSLVSRLPQLGPQGPRASRMVL